MLRIPLFVALLGLTLAACDSADPLVETPIRARVAANIAADPAVRDPSTGVARATGRYTLYSLRDSSIVLNYDNPVRTDSASTRWDIGFRGTSIIVNGGTSGPGQGAAVITTGEAGLFDSFTSVPDSLTFRIDGAAASACPGRNTPGGPVPGVPLAICGGSDNGWYNYNQPQNLITPLPGRTIFVRTADGQGYAKVQIQSYYRGAPAVPVTSGAGADQDRTYTFRYVVNPAGRSFSTLQ